MKKYLFSIIAFLIVIGVIQADTTTLTLTEVQAGLTKHRESNKRKHLLLDSYRQTHLWNVEWYGKPHSIRIWEGAGMWPGKFPILIQIHDSKGGFMKVWDISINSAAPIDAWLFRNGYETVLNIKCKHRFNSNEAIYSFKIDSADKPIEGGPATDKNALKATKRLYKELAENTK
jgi:hypothetical protein